MPSRRVRLLVALAVLAPACGTAVATDPKPAADSADAELLEFLGSVDSGADTQATADGGSWIDYLSQTDIGKVAKTADPNGISRAKQAAAGTQPATPAAPSGDKKDE
jgi:hypothetical protein